MSARVQQQLAGPITTAPRFVKVAAAPGLLMALDAAGVVWWAFIDGDTCWRRLASPAIARRPKFMDIVCASPTINGPWSVTVLDDGGRVWVRVHPWIGWVRPDGWRPWERVTDRSDPCDEAGEMVEAPAPVERVRKGKR